MLKRYPLDPTGKSSDNLVREETHEITVDQAVKIILNRAGCYYGESLKITHQSRSLVKDKDYELALFYQDATAELGHDVYAGIHLLNPDFIGTLTLTYQAVGGEYNTHHDNYLELIKNPPKNINQVLFDDIVNIPAGFVPTRHGHHVDDVYGLFPLVQVLEDIRQVLINSNALHLKNVYDRFLKLKQYVESLTAKFDDATQEAALVTKKLNERLAEIPSRAEIEGMIENKTNEVKSQLEERITDAIHQVNETVNTLSGQVTEAINKGNENAQAIQQLQQDQQNLTTNINQQITNIQNSQNAFKDEVNQTLTEKTAEIKENIEAKVRETKTELESSLNQLSNDVNNQVNEAVNRVDQVGNELHQAKEELERRVATAERTNTERLDQAKEELSNRIQQNAENDSQNRIALDNRINAIATDVTAKQTDLENRIQGNSEAIQEATQRLDQSFNQLNATVEAKLETAKEEATQQIADLHTAVQGEIVHAKEEASLDATSKAAEAVRASKAYTDELKVDTITALNDAKKKQETLENNYNQLITQMDTNNADLAGRISNNTVAINNLTTHVNDEVARVTESIPVKITEQLTPLQTSLTDLTNRVTATEGKNTEQENRIAELETNLVQTDANASWCVNQISSLTTTVQNNQLSNEEEHAEFTQQLNTLQEKLNEGKNNLTALETRLTAKDDELTQALANNVTTLTDKITEAKSKADTNENSLNTLKQKVENEYLSKSEAEQTYLKITDFANHASIGDLRTKLNDLETNYNNFKVTQEQTNTNTANDVTGLRRAIQANTNEINNLRQNIDQWSTMAYDANATASGNHQLIEDFRRKFEEHQNDYNATKNVVDENSRNLYQLPDRVSNLESSLSTTDTKMRQLENHVTHFVTQAQLEASQKKQDTKITTLEEDTARLQQQQRAQENKNADLLGLVTEAKDRGRDAMRKADDAMSQAQRVESDMNNQNRAMDGRVTALENRPIPQPPPAQIDPKTLDTLVKRKVDERIAEMKMKKPDEINPDDLIIHPDSPGTIIKHPDGSVTVTGIVYMHEDMTHNEDMRNVFTPTTCIEWTTNDEWTVPDQYDYLVAQVWVTTGLRQGESVNGKLIYHTPSTKVGYVMLKAGETVRITVGTISSFGRYITNDGVTTSNLIVPSYPVITNSLDLGSGRSLKEHFGQGGRVMLYV